MPARGGRDGSSGTVCQLFFRVSGSEGAGAGDGVVLVEVGGQHLPGSIATVAVHRCRLKTAHRLGRVDAGHAGQARAVVVAPKAVVRRWASCAAARSVSLRDTPSGTGNNWGVGPARLSRAGGPAPQQPPGSRTPLPGAGAGSRSSSPDQLLGSRRRRTSSASVQSQPMPAQPSLAAATAPPPPRRPYGQTRLPRHCATYPHLTATGSASPAPLTRDLVTYPETASVPPRTVQPRGVVTGGTGSSR